MMPNSLLVYQLIHKMLSRAIFRLISLFILGCIIEGNNGSYDTTSFPRLTSRSSVQTSTRFHMLLSVSLVKKAHRPTVCAGSRTVHDDYSQRRERYPPKQWHRGLQQAWCNRNNNFVQYLLELDSFETSSEQGLIFIPFAAV